MANKLFLVCATLALCFLLTNASIYRTVVELDEDEATNPIGPFGPKPRCGKDFQEAEHLRACQRWIRKQIRRSPWSAEDEEEEEELDIENPMGPQQWPPLLQKCCYELRQEEPQCICPTLKQAAMAVRRQGQHGPVQASRIFWTAKRLPNVCKIQKVGTCPFTAIPFFPPY